MQQAKGLPHTLSNLSAHLGDQIGWKEKLAQNSIQSLRHLDRTLNGRKLEMWCRVGHSAAVLLWLSCVHWSAAPAELAPTYCNSSHSSRKHGKAEVHRSPNHNLGNGSAEHKTWGLCIPWPRLGWWLGLLRRKTSWYRDMLKYTNVISIIKKKKKDVRSSTFFILPTNDSICDMVQNHFTHQKSIKSLQIESLWLKYSFLGRQGVYLPPWPWLKFPKQIYFFKGFVLVLHSHVS